MIDTYKTTELKISGPVKLKAIEQFSMTAQVNEHAVFSIRGIISSTDAEYYSRKCMNGEKIHIYEYSNEEENILCCGLITKIEISVDHGIYYININGISATKEFDNKKQKRSFQGASMTYKNLLKRVVGDGRNILYLCDKNKTVNGLVLQYMETDWELILRMAGHFHTVVIPDCVSGNISLAFGVPDGNTYNLTDADEYQLHLQVSSGKIMETDYTIKGPANMQLGDKILFKDKKWIIVKKSICFKNGRLESEYQLGTINGWCVPLKNNPLIHGISIRGVVTDAHDELLKIRLDLDDKKMNNNTVWYPYLPETGNLMYAMPEPGSVAFLYFPDDREDNGIVTHCENNSEEHRKQWNYHIKEFSTPENKMIQMTPNYFRVISENDKEKALLEMGDHKGIEFFSTKSVRLAAGKKVNIKSGFSSMVQAQSLITLLQSNTQNYIEICGEQIILKSERFTSSASVHKSKEVVLLNNEITEESFPDLYADFCGMMTRGKMDELSGQMLGSIPDIGYSKRNINTANRIGLKINRD
ncbi:hypothetical protein ACOAOT_14950 [Lacrimispora sp. AGF001]|uniref:hypothetical protein n=1 Tax=Lacrimispora sp. AGF001 TaxID=3401631 RepID=UPI003B42B870